MKLVLITIAIISGFLLGKLTCNTHYKRTGFWITLVIFVIINGLHSFIDGVSLVGMSQAQRIAFIVAHEIIRQPLLFIIFLAMIAPFTLSKPFRFASAFIAVTGVWIMTTALGTQFGLQLVGIESIEPYVGYFQFLFLGDIIHHLVDYWEHRKKPAPVKS